MLTTLASMQKSLLRGSSGGRRVDGRWQPGRVMAALFQPSGNGNLADLEAIVIPCGCEWLAKVLGGFDAITASGKSFQGLLGMSTPGGRSMAFIEPFFRAWKGIWGAESEPVSAILAHRMPQ